MQVLVTCDFCQAVEREGLLKGNCFLFGYPVITHKAIHVLIFDKGGVALIILTAREMPVQASLR